MEDAAIGSRALIWEMEPENVVHVPQEPMALVIPFVIVCSSLLLPSPPVLFLLLNIRTQLFPPPCCSLCLAQDEMSLIISLALSSLNLSLSLSYPLSLTPSLLNPLVLSPSVISSTSHLLFSLLIFVSTLWRQCVQFIHK